ncbi:TIGR01777 family oxidoreductase [Flavobacterium sediminilitoris]|uniref:TIGR01777 family oxidoreductase n=1 Tax=Flavobacterium sediminilitoris TaxID=2024526 RepID=A0ABY4HQ22_9FLAO|nr:MULTISPECIES: TIGR01777 family oxidoreductase [Flavobacterium]UOX33889.1 TIGR01777 family oxidoreductase [Flavobacterium sediminilitoris]
MKVLITGATGLIGNELVKLLLQNGVTVHYLSTSKSKLITQSNYKGYYWNPKSGQINTNAFDDVEVIIHLAGASVSKRWTLSYKEEIINSRVLSTRLLFQALSKNQNQVQHIISASAIGIYPSSLTNVYQEDNKQVDNSFLGEVVAKWENEVSVFERLGIKVSKVRIGLVLAQNGGALKEMLRPIKLGLGSAFGNGNQYQSWIHINDLTQIFYFIMKNKLEGVYNAVSPYPVSNKELIKTIANTIKMPCFLPNVPKFVMKLVLGEMHQILFASQNVSARKILNKGFQFKYASLDKALQNILK